MEENFEIYKNGFYGLLNEEVQRIHKQAMHDYFEELKQKYKELRGE